MTADAFATRRTLPRRSSSSNGWLRCPSRKPMRGSGESASRIERVFWSGSPVDGAGILP